MKDLFCDQHAVLEKNNVLYSEILFIIKYFSGNTRARLTKFFVEHWEQLLKDKSCTAKTLFDLVLEQLKNQTCGIEFKTWWKKYFVFNSPIEDIDLEDVNYLGKDFPNHIGISNQEFEKALESLQLWK